MTRLLHLLTGAAALAFAWYAHAAIGSSTGVYLSAGFATTGVAVLLFACLTIRTEKTIVRFGSLAWNRRDFCRGWLVTGDTGTGKTKRALNSLMYQIFENEPTWGGLCIDDKNNYKHTLLAMAAHFGREDDVILLEVRPDGAPSDWKPKHTYNLTSDRSLPWETYGKMVVDAASALGVAGDKGFFRAQVETHVPKALEALYETGYDVDLEDALNVLKNPSDLDEVLTLATRVVVMHAGRLHQVPSERDVVGRAMLGVA